MGNRSIQIYRYDHAPSIGEVNVKFKPHYKHTRDVQPDHLQNDRGLNKLTTKFKVVEQDDRDGVHCFADYQYIIPNNKNNATVNEVYEINYHFYINKKLKLLIIGGDSKQRNVLKYILQEIFNESSQHIKTIIIKRDDLYDIVQKIRNTPIPNDNDHKNIVTEFDFRNANFNDNDGVQGEIVYMFKNIKEQKCATTSESFKRNYEICKKFNVKLSIYFCQGIYDTHETKPYILALKANGEFAFGHNPAFTKWINFIIQVCVKHLTLKSTLDDST